MSLPVAEGFDVLASLVAQQVAVSRGVSSGVGIPTGHWPPPEPLRTKLTAEPYPIDALPDSIRLAVQEVEGFVKAPLALVAGSALASISLAAQAHIDVERADRLCGPTGLFFLTIADSGERKTTCDGFFSQPISAFEAAQRIDMQPVLNTYRSSLEAWESKRAGVKARIKNLAKNQKPTGDMELALLELEKTKPQAPRIPRLTYADATPEALAYGLAHNWPSGGVMSSEAGVVLGSHGMGKDSVMRNLGLLNQLWDGKALTVDRRSTESFTVAGARLTIGLQVQEPTLTEFFSRTGALSRGTGFLARFLLAWPPSTQGQRPFTQAPTHWPNLTRFHDRLRAILESTAPVNERGELTPRVMRLSAQA
ncbi:MAG: YfjI family protein, partial [Burkholderiales bacterium]